MEETMKTKAADHYFNKTEYDENSGTRYVVDVIENLFKEGEIVVSKEQIESIVARKRPEFEKRVRHVISWLKSEDLIKKEGKSIEILAIDK
jgi:hypothetical protein